MRRLRPEIGMEPVMSGSGLGSHGGQEVEEWGRCICGLPSTEKLEGAESERDPNLQIECDICHVWFHASCLRLGNIAVQTIDKYHCPKCSLLCGPSISKPITNSHRYNRTEINAAKLPKQIGTKDFVEELLRNRLIPDANDEVTAFVDHGGALTLPFLNQMGFSKPIVVGEPEGLGLLLPEPEFGIQDVPDHLDNEFQIDVIDVYSQDTTLMDVREFCDAFKLPENERNSPLNCLSLEVSSQPMGEKVQPPLVARKLCWVNNVWPQNAVWSSSPPQVQKYCIMSMKNAFTGGLLHSSLYLYMLEIVAFQTFISTSEGLRFGTTSSKGRRFFT